MHSDFIFRKSFQAEMLVTQANACDTFSLRDSIYLQFLSLDLCLPSLPNIKISLPKVFPCKFTALFQNTSDKNTYGLKLVSEEVVRPKGGNLIGAKASKIFLIHHFNSFAASSEM